MATSANKAEVLEIVRAVNATKTFRAVKKDNKHWKVLTAKGAVVTDENGPLIISATPGEHRFKEMTVKRFMKAGVFKVDPFKETRGTKQEREEKGIETGSKVSRADRLKDPDVVARREAAKLAAIAAKSEKAREETAQMRADLEPIIVKLGGWKTHWRQESGVAASDLGRVVEYWAKSRGRVEYPKKGPGRGEVDPEGAARKFLRKDESLGDMWRPIFRLFIDELLRAEKSYPGGAREWFFNEYRKMKGLVTPEPTSPGAGPDPVDTPEGHSLVRQVLERPAAPIATVNGNGNGEHEQLGPLHARLPVLALEAAFLMGRAPETDTARALVIAEKIAELEMAGAA